MRRSAYTLMEVLIVLVLLALLFTLLLPIASSVSATARKTKCISNLHQLSLAFRTYTEDHGRLPPCDTRHLGGRWITTSQGQKTVAWWDLLLPRVGGNPDVLVCPESDSDQPGYIMNISVSAQPLYKGKQGEKILAADRRFPTQPSEWIGAGTGLPDFVGFRHQDGAIFLYVDGRVKWQRRPEVESRQLWELSQ